MTKCIIKALVELEYEIDYDFEAHISDEDNLNNLATLESAEIEMKLDRDFKDDVYIDNQFIRFDNVDVKSIVADKVKNL
jgi:hypothetical protein